MKTVHIVSAFTAHGTGGNKAGVVLAADDLSDQTMQYIATELDLSETAFVSASNTATFRLRFFTTTDEVDLCGHATIAAWSLLFQRGQIGSGTYSQETGAGILGVRIATDGLVFMEQAEPKFLGTIRSETLTAALGLLPNDFSIDLRPQIVSTGLKDILVPVRSSEILAKIKPDLAKIKELSQNHGVVGMHVFSLIDDGIHTAVARNFAPLVGIDEESATGTANGALLSYLLRHGQLHAADQYCIEQGESMGQRSKILARFTGGKIWIGGRAVLQEEVSVSAG